MDFYQNFKKQVPLFNRRKAEKNIPDKAVSKLQIKEGIFRLRCIFWHKKGISQWSKVSPKTAFQGLIPDGLHGREP
jgi:hypothetical protein